MSLGTDPTWFYFDHQGDIIHSSENGAAEMVHLGNNQYVLVDFNGMTKSGLAFQGNDKVRVRDVYYFDPENQNYRTSGTKEITLPDGRKEWYTFGAKGIGGTSEAAAGPADADFTAYIGSNE